MLLLSLLFALVGLLAFRSGVRTRRLHLSVGGGAALLLAGMLLAGPAAAEVQMWTCHAGPWVRPGPDLWVGIVAFVAVALCCLP